MTWILVIYVLGGVDQVNCFGQISFPFTKEVKTGQLLEDLTLSVASNTPSPEGISRGVKGDKHCTHISMLAHIFWKNDEL